MDWDRYRRKLSTIVSSLGHFEDPLALHKVLIDTIKQVAIESQTKPIPMTGGVRSNPTIWWDWECSKMLKKRSNAFKQFRALGRSEDFLNYKKVEAESKRLFKTKKWVLETASGIIRQRYISSIFVVNCQKNAQLFTS